MSGFPCEILDHIVDLLHDSQAYGQIPLDLRNCCLISKSWIPRTRRHLFAEIHFRTQKNLESWKKTFPDPSTSPARYAKFLWIGCPQVVMAEGAGTGGWIPSFSSVKHLELGGQDVDARGWEVVFALFHGFSPAIKSLCMNMSLLPFPRFFDLVLSFPLLEDLAIFDCHDALIDNDGDSDVLDMPTAVQPSSVPVFTGTLDLHLEGGPVGAVINWLLSPPGGIHFRKLTFSWFCEEDIPLTMALMEECSHTLESLYICCDLSGTSIGHHIRMGSLFLFLDGPRSTSFTLSKATKLRDVTIRPGSRRVEWITVVLQTVGHEHRDLLRVSIEASPALTIIPDYIFPDVGRAVGEGILEQWLDLDRLLLHLWQTRSIRSSVMRVRTGSKADFVDCIGCLLPEITKRGMIDLVG